MCDFGNASKLGKWIERYTLWLISHCLHKRRGFNLPSLVKKMENWRKKVKGRRKCKQVKQVKQVTGRNGTGG